MALIGEFGRALAEAEAVGVEPDHFLFCGERFEVPVEVSGLPLMRFAWRSKAIDADTARAKRDLDRAMTDAGRAEAEARIGEFEQDGNACIYELLRSVLPQWERFEELAIERAVDVDELLMVCGAIYQAVTGRPTKRSSGSSDGPLTSGDGSMDGSGSLEPTPGQWRSETGVPARRVLTDRERARMEIEASLRPVANAIRSGV